MSELEWAHAQGIHGVGPSSYTADQKARVIDCVRDYNEQVGIAPTVAEVASATGLRGNTIRAIMSAADGVDLLLGGNGNGYKLAANSAEVEKLTMRLESQIAKMQERVIRRRELAAYIYGS